MIALRALRLAMIVFVLLCIVMTLLAEFQRLTTAHAQTTLTPGVTQGASTSSLIPSLSCRSYREIWNQNTRTGGNCPDPDLLFRRPVHSG
jgi:hypothetical protein